MMRLGGLQARPPADRPRQLPGPGPPPSPLLHVWDSDCLPEQFMVSARTPGDSLPTVPWPQFYCPSCPLSHQPPHPTPSWPRNPAGAELRPAARSEPFMAAMVRLSPEAAPGSPPGLCVHCRPAASQSTPWCWPIPKRQRLLALLSEHEWTRVLGLACCTHMPTQHTCTHADTHTSSHSRVHAHTCTPTHRETHASVCTGPAGLAGAGGMQAWLFTEQTSKHLAGTCCGPTLGTEAGTNTAFPSTPLCPGVLLAGRERCPVAPGSGPSASSFSRADMGSEASGEVGWGSRCN